MRIYFLHIIHTTLTTTYNVISMLLRIHKHTYYIKSYICYIFYNKKYIEMNIVSLAQKGNLALFKEFLDLKHYRLDISDSVTIFKTCMYDIQEEFYERYKYDIRLFFNAVIYSDIVELPRVCITDPYQAQYINDVRLFESRKVLIDTSIIMHLSLDIIPYLRPYMISGKRVEIEYDIKYKKILQLNPILGQYLNVELDMDYDEYDYELLVLFIKHCNVSYGMEGYYLTDTVCSNIEGIRQNGLSKWKLDCIITEWDNLDFRDLDTYVRMGYPPNQLVYPYNISYDDEEAIMRNIQYLQPGCILLEYILGGLECLLDYIIVLDEPEYIELTSDIIKNIYRLGKKYWPSIEIDISILDTITHEELLQYGEIMEYASIYSNRFSFEMLILSCQYVNNFNLNNTALDIRYNDLPIDIVNHMYKDGAKKLWKAKHTDPAYAMLFFQHLSHILPELDPPIPKEYYKFLDEKTIKRISGISNVSAFSDVTVCTH